MCLLQLTLNWMRLCHVTTLSPAQQHSVKESESASHSVMSDSLQPHGLSMEFSRPEYWSGQPFPSPGDLPIPGIEPRSPALQADSLPATREAQEYWTGQPIPSPGDLPDTGIEPGSPALQADFFLSSSGPHFYNLEIIKFFASIFPTHILLQTFLFQSLD